MPIPVLESAAADLYDRMTPMADLDASLGWPLANYCAGIGTMLQVVDDYARDQIVNGKTAPGWSQLLDPNRCPVEALPYLGMMVGVVVNTALSEADQRAQIKSEQGWQRGTLNAIIAAAASQVLGGPTQTVLSSSPSLYWYLNDDYLAGIAHDSSGSGHDGTTSGSVTLGGRGSATPGDSRSSADFYGGWITSSYKPFVNGSKRTYVGWAWQDAATGNQVLIASSAASPAVGYIGSASFAFHPNLDVGAPQLVWSMAGFGTGGWYHWVLTYDDATGVGEFFLNGASQGKQSLPVAQNYRGAGNFQVGGMAGWTSWDGAMQDIAVFERILSPTEINNIFKSATVAGSGKHVTVVERDPVASPAWPAYGLSVYTRLGETPNSAAVLAALMAQKPAGIILNYQALPDVTYQDIFANYATYQVIYTTFSTYEGVFTRTPGE